MSDTFILRGPFPDEVETEERCRITELLNDPAVPEVSLALARVAPGITTRRHALRGTVERYVVRSGRGEVEVGGERRAVGPGDRVLIPAGTDQRITNTGPVDLEFYCVCTPRFRDADYVDTDPDPLPR